MPLDEYTISLIKGKNLGIVVTLMPDGQPQALPTWIDTDGEYLLVNTERERQRSKNIARDPRVTVLVMSSESPWDWSELRGRVVDTIDGDEALRHIHKLANKYVGRDYIREIGPTGRIIFKIAPDKVLTAAMLGYT
jgi:PPOX class probable F420-dependent enzyme